MRRSTAAISRSCGFACQRSFPARPATARSGARGNAIPARSVSLRWGVRPGRHRYRRARAAATSALLRPCRPPDAVVVRGRAGAVACLASGTACLSRTAVRLARAAAPDGNGLGERPAMATEWSRQTRWVSPSIACRSRASSPAVRRRSRSAAARSRASWPFAGGQVPSRFTLARHAHARPRPPGPPPPRGRQPETRRPPPAARLSPPAAHGVLAGGILGHARPGTLTRVLGRLGCLRRVDAGRNPPTSSRRPAVSACRSRASSPKKKKKKKKAVRCRSRSAAARSEKAASRSPTRACISCRSAIL